MDHYLDAQEVIVARKIHQCLPSFKAEFTASVPLTRIRDIAHRSDIPHALKVMLHNNLLPTEFGYTVPNETFYFDFDWTHVFL